MLFSCRPLWSNHWWKCTGFRINNNKKKTVHLKLGWDVPVKTCCVIWATLGGSYCNLWFQISPFEFLIFFSGEKGERMKLHCAGAAYRAGHFPSTSFNWHSWFVYYWHACTPQHACEGCIRLMEKPAWRCGFPPSGCIVLLSNMAPSSRRIKNKPCQFPLLGIRCCARSSRHTRLLSTTLGAF